MFKVGGGGGGGVISYLAYSVLLELTLTRRFTQGDWSPHVIAPPLIGWGLQGFLMSYFMLSGGAEALERTVLKWEFNMLKSVLMGQSLYVV